MATVFDVAKYIIDQCGEMDTWKLKKLVCYCQAWSLAWDGKPLFDSRIEAWANGPVCPDLFMRHKGFFIVGPESPIWEGADPDALTETERETVDAVLKEYGDRPGHWLRALTHLEDPWKQARAFT